MKTAILALAASLTGPSNSAVNYGVVTGGPANATWGASGSLGNLRTPISAAGVLSTLYVRLPVALTGAQTWTFTLVKNGTDTGLSCTVTSSGLIASDLATTVSVSAGDDICVKSSPSGSPNAQTNIQVSMIFESTTAGEGVMFSYMTNGTAVESFMAPGMGSAVNASEVIRTVVMPAPGDIDRFDIRMGVAPGGVTTRKVTLRKNGVDTGLTTGNITGSTTTASATGTTVSVVAGDTISWHHEVTGAPASSQINLGASWKPTTDGDTVVFGAPTGAPPNTGGARYFPLRGAASTAETTESNTYNISPVALDISGLRADISTAAGTSKSRDVTLRVNGAASLATVNISGSSALTATDSTHTIRTAAGDLLDIETVPNSTPANVTFMRVSAIVKVVSAPPVVAFSPADKTNQVFEGIRQASSVIVRGTYSATPTDVQVALYDAPTGGNLVAAYGSATFSAGAYTRTITGVAVGGPYYQRVRDNGGTATTSALPIYVGVPALPWGQSQCNNLGVSDVGGLVATAGMKVFFCKIPTETAPSTPVITDVATGYATLGSGIVAMANQWYADCGAIPLMIIDCNFPGTSIDDWINDAAIPGGTGTLWTDIAVRVMAYTDNQASAVCFDQGTADASGYAAYAAKMDTLKAKFEAQLSGQDPLFLVAPHPRSNDGPNTWPIRNVQYAKAISGGDWRLWAWALDIEMDADGSPHQSTNAAGNRRLGTRFGRGLAKNLIDGALDILGPQVTSAMFNAGRTAFTITYDRDIETPAAATTGLPGFVTDAADTFATTVRTMTAAITAARQVTVTKDSGAWAAGTRFDYLRGVPFSSDNGDGSDYVGPESTMEANYFAKVITDTTSFDGSRGMPASPIMGTGMAVADYTDPPTGGGQQTGMSLSLGVHL